MGLSTESRTSWLARLLARFVPKYAALIQEVVGDPYDTNVSTEHMGMLLSWRFVMVLPLVTIPTYLQINNLLPHSYAPAAGTLGAYGWYFAAIFYALILMAGTVLHRRESLNRSMAIALTLAALVAEITLSSFYAYLIGVGGGAHYVTGTLSIIMLTHRLFLHFRFGVLSLGISLLACTLLVMLPYLDVPVSPLRGGFGDQVRFNLQDLLFAYSWCLTVFLGTNLATNRMHGLRSELQVTYNKLGKLHKFMTESVLKRYLPPSLIQQIMAGDVSMDDEAQTKTVTILFTDLKGFTAISEQLGPQAVGELLNDYFTTMNEVIFEHGGTIDKFIGDAIMVFFGAPQDLNPKTQAEQAAACGLAMQENMKVLASRWAPKGIKNLSMRVGIHQGEAVVGNFGSNQRMDYTCIGPSVNLASRIETACEPGLVYVSEPVFSQLEHSAATELGEFELKGIGGKTRLYELV